MSQPTRLVHEPEAGPRRSRARVRVLPLVSGDHDGRVVGGTLHPLLHAATGGGATVVAPKR